VLSSDADIIIIDPEREYSQLVNAMGGEVINISATSNNHINAMDMNKDYGDGANPVILKSEFIMSLCEQLIGGTNLGAKQKSIIDRCTASVYRSYQQNDYQGHIPTLQDFRTELLQQDEPEAKELALAIELFTHGSLNTFYSMKTNIFIGNVIIRNSEWGNKFVENLSKDMKMRFPSAKGYSVRNLKYMKKFAQIFTEDDVDEYGLGRITWSHHQILMSKVSNREEYIWYLEKTLEHKWSVDDLTSQVKSQLYERQAVANKISNFERRLPAEQKDMVLSTMKDPYMFDFINYTEEMLETDIENELVKNVTSLLMELGTGFAFMGQQYHLEVGGKDFYIDLLFYNTKLRCYVAIDLKTGEFKPEQAGKMNFYLSALDDLVKAPEDNPSVGLILCRDENRTIAEYALRDMSKPIGVSEYHLCTDLPLDLKNALPAVEDIRSRIDMKK